MKTNRESSVVLAFYGGPIGALIPFIIFIVGVVSVALSGAPDEKGFWPILILSLGIGLVLSRDKTAYSHAVLDGMSDKMVMIMLMAWMLASIIGVLMTETGFIDGLTWLVARLKLGSVGFVLASFVICCIVSLSTGSSFATILICGPILYPVGGLLGSYLPILAGSILAGATFGDFFAPISDTTISSSLSQNADIGKTVKSRLKFILPAAVLAFIAFLVFAISKNTNSIETSLIEGSPKGLIMMIVPVFIIFLFLKGKHLIHGLLFGVLAGTALGFISGLLPVEKIFVLDLDNFSAKSFIIDGIQRALGISVFTILLMGLVGVIKKSGLLDRILVLANRKTKNKRQGEISIALMMSMAVLLITHSAVAILTVADVTKSIGARLNISALRRANILSLVACIFPFLLPYFIPVILMASMTASGSDYGIDTVSPLSIGMHNFLSWSLLIITIVTLIARKRKIKK